MDCWSCFNTTNWESLMHSDSNEKKIRKCFKFSDADLDEKGLWKPLNEIII